MGKESDMKKKTLSMLLALTTLLALAACGSGSSGGSPAADDTVYTLSYASNDGTTVERHTMFVQVVKEEIEARSNGRIIIEIYPSGTLAKPGEVIEGLKNGTVDMGLDNATFYPGMYPYTDLWCASGFNPGNTEKLHKMSREYADAYAAADYTEVKLLMLSTTGLFGIYSNRDIKTAADLAGLQCRVTSNYISFFELLGISGIMMASGEVYEGIRLGVIEANLTNISSVTAFNLDEVTGNYTSLPMTFGDMCIVMSQQAYNNLPADLQAVIDGSIDFIHDTWLNYLLTVEVSAKEVVAGRNPDFKWNELPGDELAKIIDLVFPMFEEKAAAMDAAGLDGSGAMEWLIDHSA